MVKKTKRFSISVMIRSMRYTVLATVGCYCIHSIIQVRIAICKLMLSSGKLFCLVVVTYTSVTVILKKIQIVSVIGVIDHSVEIRGDSYSIWEHSHGKLKLSFRRFVILCYLMEKVQSSLHSHRTP